MEDKYLWLEDVLGDKSLAWARERNKKTIDLFGKEEWFNQDVENLQKILESKEKIPVVYFIEDGFVYSFWTDEKNIQGLLRRTTIESYKQAAPAWDVLLDLDVLSQAEGKKWVFHDFDISPNKKRALVSLSPGGTDADVVREFDILTRTFVKDGFELPVAKGSAQWMSDDELFVSRDFGPETITNSGYARLIKRWKRGEPLEKALTIFEIPKENNATDMRVYHEDGKASFVAAVHIDFYTTEFFKYDGSHFKQLDLPKKFESTGGNLTGFNFVLSQDWKEFLIGDVLHFDYATEVAELVYRAPANSAIYSARTIKSGLFIIVDTDVKGSFYYVKKENGKWIAEKIDLPENGSLDTLTTSVQTDDFFIMFDSFNTPVSYYYGNKNKIEAIVKRQPGFFDFENTEVSQHFTKSPDGTRVPYFVVHKKGLKYDGKNPTILYGYGGFEISLKPHFSNILGKVWFEKGGVYVLANIRGGGEYGPAWHQSALKEKRQRAYDDFYAIAEDVIAKNITSSQHLGAHGGSNGGLLMGVCFTQRPELFKAINCGVPLLDMRRYHKLLAGYSWIAEYGNPDEADGVFISKLSPYHNINEEQKNYPMMFLNTSTKDDRVHPGHARKFAATLEEYGVDYIYHENIDGGHAGASNLKELAFMKAMDYAFFWKYLK
jgi:prolyl oligopeptidase